MMDDHLDRIRTSLDTSGLSLNDRSKFMGAIGRVRKPEVLDEIMIVFAAAPHLMQLFFENFVKKEKGFAAQSWATWEQILDEEITNMKTLKEKFMKS